MYLVKYKGNVIIGAIPWDSRYIIGVMKNRYSVVVDLPEDEPEESKFPLEVTVTSVLKFLPSEIITIYPAKEEYNGVIENPLIDYLYGPIWKFTDSEAIGQYEVKSLDLNSAKQNYFEKASQIRYNKEIAGTVVNIDKTEYKIQTDRKSRNMYVGKYISCQDDQKIMWKFEQEWKSLTRQDLKKIISMIDLHVQSAFDWEYQITNLIESAESLSKLRDISELNLPEYNN